ncbi:MAG: alpha-(1-_3)-arabinofuranosyltransferase family protein [Microthrixaceae bacterium]
MSSAATTAEEVSDDPARRSVKYLADLRRVPIGVLALGVVAYVPLLLTAPGVVGADTKSYLYLDPSRLLGRAPLMWDTHIGLGTVTHQNIGYLWPMGPWYWFFDTIGVPDWIAQRLWLGTIIFAAGMGVRFMLRELRWVGPGLTVASFAYALSPYLLHYGARISVILLPFAGLPWLIGLTSRSVHRGGWRWPAVFALVTLTVGGVNATSLLLVMAGPLLWLVHAIWVTREVQFRHAMAAGLRIAALTGITSLWWVAGLALQGTYGIPILRYTETYYTVANAALSTELIRGLGYWFFYGRDALGAWIEPAQRMVQSIPHLVLSFAIPGVALLSGFLTRFRNRGFFALLVAVGLVSGVGAHPWDASTPAGAVFKEWTRSDSGLAFRSTPRAVPLIALGLAVLLAAVVAAVASRPNARNRWAGTAVAGVLLVAICANQWALFAGEMVDRNLQRPEEVPGYWTEAAAAMDAGDHDTRVYETPGTDFASYRWGNTVDPITPGLIDRPYAARELIPYGTPASADLLNAWDLPLQEGRFDPRAITPVAQLMGIGTIAQRGDLQYERFRTPRPDITYHQLNETPGLSSPESFGAEVSNETTGLLRLDDEVRLGTPTYWEHAPAVSLFDVQDRRPIARTVSADSPTLLAGDGAGVVAWAGIGALDPDRILLYSASFTGDREALDQQLATPGAQLVVTDTNRRQARRWGSVRENDGYTERAGEEPLEVDPADNRLEKFPEAPGDIAGNEAAGDDADADTDGGADPTFTVSEQVGGATVSASAYGNPVSYTPSDRAARAFDGDPSTAWRVGAFDEPRGEYLEIELDKPVTTDQITIQQTQRDANRWITQVELYFDSDGPYTVALGSGSGPGVAPEVIPLQGDVRFSTLRVKITETNLPRLDRYVGVSDVGIAELGIPGVEPVTEWVRPPTQLLDAAGPSSIDHPLTYLFTRRAANPAEVVVSDEETVLRRYVDAPVARSYTAYGTARMSTQLADSVVDDLLGVTGARAESTSRLPGDLRSRGTSAIDGDDTTAWQTPINFPTGQTLTIRSEEPFDIDGLPILLRRDGLHSVPTRVSIAADGGAPEAVDVPEVGVGDREVGAAGAIEVTLPYSASGVTELAITIDEVDEANSIDWFGGSTTVLPVGIVEVSIPVAATVPEPDAPLPQGCRDDLLRIEGEAVPVRLEGTVGAALEGSLIDYAGCAPVDIGQGRSELVTQPGAESGFDLERVALASAPGGAPGRDTIVAGPEPVAAPPGSSSEQTGDLAWRTDVQGAEDPYWVVLGESVSPGFTATATSADGSGEFDLGESTLVNGYANGWRVDPEVVGADATITIRFAPQATVWIALGLSGLGVLVCVALVLIRRPRITGSPDGDIAPMRVRPIAVFDPDGMPVSLGRSVGISLAAGFIALVFMGWMVGAIVAVTAMCALFAARGQVLVRVAGPVLFAAAAGFVIAKQARGDYLVDFNWMNLFEVTHVWTLAAVALLVLDVVVAHVRRSGPDRSDPRGATGLSEEASGTPRTARGSGP